MEDLGIIALLYPTTGTVDTVNQSIKARVKVKNFHPSVDYNDVILHAVAGSSAVSHTITKLDANSETEVVFDQPYVVPNSDPYTLTVYLESRDNNTLNDTLSVVRQSVFDQGLEHIDLNEPFMSQNIPNPAHGTTKVNYRIPEDGKVVFSVYTVTGQTLMRKIVDAVSGVHSVEFDVTNLAAGIYYYSMDYNGRKIVKKMNIRK
jgi:hypothetical protein